MNKALYLFSTLLFVACTQQEESILESTSKDNDTAIEQTIIEKPTRVKRDSTEIETKLATPTPMSTFNGNWFRVEYPGSFKASPTSPIKTFDQYTFIETDEARFTSPDGTVEFFVFSPQWGGDPIDYLIEQSNEKTIAQSEDKANSNDPFAVSHHWVTYEDKEGKYTRSYHSLMTQSTHHVFGVKYSSRKMYERYKASYLEFKKSLQQFAD